MIETNFIEKLTARYLIFSLILNMHDDKSLVELAI